MIAIILSSIVAIAGSSALYYLYKSGYFLTPTVDTVQTENRTILYKIYRGPYHESGDKFDDATAFLSIDKKEITVFAAYYDSPAEVSPDQTRYAIGVQVTENISQETIQEMQDNGYELVTLPGCLCAHVYFPFETHLSISLAAERVYGTIYSHVAENNLLPEGESSICYEITQGNKWDFYIPIDHSVDLKQFYLNQV